MLLLHQFEELCIVLRLLELVEEEFHGLDFIHVVDELTQHPGLLEHFRIQQQLFAAGAERVRLMAGKTRFSAMRRSRWISLLPVPLNSS